MRIKDVVDRFQFSVKFRNKGTPYAPNFVGSKHWGKPGEFINNFIYKHDRSVYSRIIDEADGEDFIIQSYAYEPSGEDYWKYNTEYEFAHHISMLSRAQKKKNGFAVTISLEGKLKFYGRPSRRTIDSIKDKCYFPVEKICINGNLHTMYRSPKSDRVYADIPTGSGKSTLFLAKCIQEKEIKTFRATVKEVPNHMENIKEYGNKEEFELAIEERENFTKQELDYIEKREPDFANA